MPIKQERMLALLAAAQDFENGLRRALGQVAREAEAAAQGRKTAEEALNLLALLLRLDTLLDRPIESVTTIALETAHFSAARQRHNAKAAFRAARRRVEGQAQGQTTKGERE